MASTVLVRDLLGRVSDTLLDTSPQFTRWSEEILIGWLNEAQLVIAKYLPYTCARVDALRLRPGTLQNIGTILAADMHPTDGTPARAINGNALMSVSRNLGADGQSPGRAIRIVDRDVLDASDPDWHTATPRVPVSGYVFDPRNPKVFYVTPPVPADRPHWVEISYMADPAIIAVGSGQPGSSVVLSIDDKNVDDAFNYIMARAQMKDAEAQGNASLANAYVTLFTASINAQATALLGVNPNLGSLPINPSMPATAR